MEEKNHLKKKKITNNKFLLRNCFHNVFDTWFLKEFKQLSDIFKWLLLFFSLEKSFFFFFFFYLCVSSVEIFFTKFVGMKYSVKYLVFRLQESFQHLIKNIPILSRTIPLCNNIWIILNYVIIKFSIKDDICFSLCDDFISFFAIKTLKGSII